MTRSAGWCVGILFASSVTACGSAGSGAAPVTIEQVKQVAVRYEKSLAAGDVKTARALSCAQLAGAGTVFMTEPGAHERVSRVHRVGKTSWLVHIATGAGSGQIVKVVQQGSDLRVCTLAPSDLQG